MIERDYSAPREILAAGSDPEGQTSIFEQAEESAESEEDD